MSDSEERGAASSQADGHAGDEGGDLKPCGCRDPNGCKGSATLSVGLYCVMELPISRAPEPQIVDSVARELFDRFGRAAGPVLTDPTGETTLPAELKDAISPAGVIPEVDDETVIFQTSQGRLIATRMPPVEEDDPDLWLVEFRGPVSPGAVEALLNELLDGTPFR